MNNTINHLFKYYIFFISIDGVVKGVFLSSSLFFLAYIKDVILFALLLITIIIMVLIGIVANVSAKHSKGIGVKSFRVCN